MAQVALNICEICTGAPGSQFCLDCEQLFCSHCKSLHKRQKVSANHKFVDELISLKKENHGLLLSKSEIINKKIEQLGKGLIQLDKDVASTIKQVTEEGARIKAMVDRHVERVISNLRSKTGYEKKKVDKMISDAKELQTKMKELEKRNLELEKNRLAAGLLAKLKLFNRDITKIEAVSVSSQPSVVYKTKVATEKDTQALMGFFTLSEVKLETDTISPRTYQYPDQQ